MKSNGIGLKLKLKRIGKGIKQKDLADKVGIGAVRLCRIEKGVALPKPEEIERIKQALEAA